MYVFTLDFTERVIKTAQLEGVKGELEAKRTDLILKGKESERLDKMISDLDELFIYLHELFEYAEKETAYARKLEGEIREEKIKNESLKKEVEFLK